MHTLRKRSLLRAVEALLHGRRLTLIAWPGATRARAPLKDIVEMPDHQADRVLRSIEQNRGQLSNVLAKEIPVLRQSNAWTDIVEAVSHAMANKGDVAN